MLLPRSVIPLNLELTESMTIKALTAVPGGPDLMTTVSPRLARGHSADLAVEMMVVAALNRWMMGWAGPPRATQAVKGVVAHCCSFRPGEPELAAAADDLEEQHEVCVYAVGLGGWVGGWVGGKGEGEHSKGCAAVTLAGVVGEEG